MNDDVSKANMLQFNFKFAVSLVQCVLVDTVCVVIFIYLSNKCLAFGIEMPSNFRFIWQKKQIGAGKSDQKCRFSLN